MLEPKKIKYRRHHRGNRRGMASRGSHVAFGAYGLKALEPGWITARQIEASRIVISRIVEATSNALLRGSTIEGRDEIYLVQEPMEMPHEAAEAEAAGAVLAVAAGAREARVQRLGATASQGVVALAIR